MFSCEILRFDNLNISRYLVMIMTSLTVFTLLLTHDYSIKNNLNGFQLRNTGFHLAGMGSQASSNNAASKITGGAFRATRTQSGIFMKVGSAWRQSLQRSFSLRLPDILQRCLAILCPRCQTVNGSPQTAL